MDDHQALRWRARCTEGGIFHLIECHGESPDGVETFSRTRESNDALTAISISKCFLTDVETEDAERIPRLHYPSTRIPLRVQADQSTSILWCTFLLYLMLLATVSSETGDQIMGGRIELLGLDIHLLCAIQPPRTDHLQAPRA
jgi:hypothetical protein